MFLLICITFVLQGSFYLLVYGLTLSLAIFVLELLRHKYLKLRIKMQSIFKSSKGI
jgi:hypothetical protein